MRTMARFATEWDTAPNPVYDVWTAVNGSEILPGIISPFTATCFNRYDYEGLRSLMASYGITKVRHFKRPVGNFFGVVAGRLVLNSGYSVAAISAMEAGIAQAILQQFFTGAGGADRFIVKTTDAQRAAAYAKATEQRDRAVDTLASYRDRLLAERAGDRAAQDRHLSLRPAWDRFEELCRDNSFELLNTHYMVSV